MYRCHDVAYIEEEKPLDALCVRYITSRPMYDSITKHHSIFNLKNAHQETERKIHCDHAASVLPRIHSATPRPPFTFFTLSYFLHRVLDIPARNFRSLPATIHRCLHFNFSPLTIQLTSTLLLQLNYTSTFHLSISAFIYMPA